MIKRFFLDVLRTFFVEQSTLYSVHVMTQEGNRPLGQWFRGFNPPREGEFIAIEKEETQSLPKPDKRYELYKVVNVTTTFYKTKPLQKSKKEGVIVVEYLCSYPNEF